MSAVIFPDTM